MDFIDFSLDANLMSGVNAAGYVTCTPVQEQVLKMALDGSDLYVQSQTGTGKTAAYLISIVQELLADEKSHGKKVLVMVPTRELAVQVEEESKTLNTSTGLKSFSFYGGVGYEKQTAALERGVDIIVGTPGRIIDLHKSKTLDLSGVAFLVIDEADRMFDMGFYPDLREILKFLPAAETRQTMLFSATLNTYVKNLAWEYTRDAKEITIEAENITVDQITQELLHVASDDKMKLLVGILKKENPDSVIIFCNTKRSCEVVAKRLQMNDIPSEFIIGDLPQSRRLKVINDFKAGKISCLVATDVAARGIDVDDLAMVMNFDLPNEAENYVHRIGRTARAGKSGKAYTFCSEQDVYNLPAIERYIEMHIPSKVADPDAMVEDKSAGVYIKTENWHEESDERDERRARRREREGGRRSDTRARKPRDKDDRRERRGARSEHSGARLGSHGCAHAAEKVSTITSTQEGIEQLEAMSYEERMKLYREKYGNVSVGRNDAQATGEKTKRGGAGESRRADKGKKRGQEKRKQTANYERGDGKYHGKNEKRSGDANNFSKKPRGKNVSAGRQGNSALSANHAEKKKTLANEGFFAKIKRLFGGK